MKFYDPRTAPSVYDVVWCKWPWREDKLAPGPDVRPVLVIDVRLMVDQRTDIEWAAVTAVYGTGGEHLRPSDILGSLNLTLTESRALGLHKATIFRLDLRNRKRLPWAEDYFVPQSYVRSQGVIAGSLDDEQRTALHQCFDRLGHTFPLP